MRYVIKRKDSDLYLADDEKWDGEYTTEIARALTFQSKAWAAYNACPDSEEVVEIECDQ